MKRNFLFVLALFGTFLTVPDTSFGQKKKATKKKVNTKKKTTKVTNVEPPVEPPVTPVAANIELPIPKFDSSKRPTSAVENSLIKDKTPLEYEYLRQDDQLYKQVIWRNINVKEKMNQPFGYENVEENGDQRLIYILMNAIQNGGVVPFGGLNDRFTTPMTIAEISQMLVGTPYVIKVHNWTKDPTGSDPDAIMDSTIMDEFNPASIETFQIKEEVIFDKESSRLHFRILGIAPMKKSSIADANGNYQEFPIFWLYYPELRPTLAKYEAYNPRNFANRMSWEEVFESRYFSSYITKSTLNNPQNKTIAGMVSDPLLRLVEGENVKEAIFNFEQGQWSY